MFGLGDCIRSHIKIDFMIRNYIKVAYRNLLRNKAHTFINMAGLAVGLTCSLLILLWVQSELSIDAYHVNGSRLYKVYEREHYDHKIEGNYDTPALLARELKKTLPAIQYAVSMQDENDIHTFKAGNKVLKMEGAYADADLFKMFSYPLLQGTPETALSSPVSIAISKNMAARFFGKPEAAMGKTIRLDNEKDFMVSAVFEQPANTSRKFEYIINWDAYLAKYPGSKVFTNTGPLTYVMLKPGADAAQVDKQLTHFIDNYAKRRGSYYYENGLQLYSQVYLHSNFTNGK